MDLLRLVFATLVLLAHAPELTDHNQSRELFSRWTHSTMTFGSLGVDGFFALSGFLILKSWDGDPELGNFLQKRILRIVPGYLVACILSTVVIGLIAPGVPNFFHHFDRHFAMTLVLLHEPHTPPVLPGNAYPDVNGSLWTIAHEFRCYLLVALLGLCGVMRRRWIWLVATAVGWVAMIAYADQKFPWHFPYLLLGEPNETARLVTPFLFGGCLYLFRDRIRYRPAYALLALAACVVTDLLRPQVLEDVFVIAGTYLLFYFVETPSPAQRLTAGMPDISYGVYLYGWPVESLWIWYRHGSPWVAFAGATAITFVLGWLSWHLVERPMLTLKRKPTAVLAPV
jgi:peptidoglycan/LPS O-acetylase OafA/YrhL